MSDLYRLFILLFVLISISGILIIKKIIDNNREYEMKEKNNSLIKNK